MRMWPYSIARHVLEPFERALVEPLDHALRDDRDAVVVSHPAPLDHAADDDVGDLLERDVRARELLRDDRQRAAGRLAYAEGQRAGLAAHAHGRVPARRGLGVLHEALDDGCAHRPRRFEPEGRHVLGQRQIIVDRLRDRHHFDVAACGFRYFGGAVGRVVAADAQQVRDAERCEAADAVLQRRLIFGRIRARRAQDRTAGPMDAAHVVDVQLDGVLRVAASQPLKPVIDAEDATALIDRFDRGGGDDAVDARCRPAAHQDA